MAIITAKPIGTCSRCHGSGFVELKDGTSMRCADCNGRVDVIGTVKRRVPVIPPIVDPPPFEPNPVVAQCGQCGLELRQTMMYVCGHPNCPTGLGGPTC